MLDTRDFASARKAMVERQLLGRGIRDGRVLAAMGEVPRERFVEDGFAGFAYDDRPLPAGDSQTISQPYIVALMLEAAEVGPSDRVLEIGAGSGYAAAVIARLAKHLVAIERLPGLAEQAGRRLQRLGCDNVEVHCADGTQGWPKAAPYDAIIVSAGAPDIPQALQQQLVIGGRLVIPAGASAHYQLLLKLRRSEEDRFEREDLGAVSFVPLIGRQGWPSTSPSQTEEA
jgi:protein-L-isoaspartate(D-aspartate) O-methyltransferase